MKKYVLITTGIAVSLIMVIEHKRKLRKKEVMSLKLETIKDVFGGEIAEHPYDVTIKLIDPLSIERYNAFVLNRVIIVLNALYEKSEQAFWYLFRDYPEIDGNDKEEVMMQIERQLLVSEEQFDECPTSVYDSLKLLAWIMGQGIIIQHKDESTIKELNALAYVKKEINK